MASKRVYELAKELKQSSKDLIRAIKEIGIPVSNHMSSLEEIDVERVYQYYTPPEEKKVIEKRIKSTIIRRRTERLKPELEPEPSKLSTETETQKKAEPPREKPAPKVKHPEAIEKETSQKLHSPPIKPKEKTPGEEKKLAKETKKVKPALKPLPGAVTREKKRPPKKAKLKPKEEPAKVISKPQKIDLHKGKDVKQEDKPPVKHKKKRVFIAKNEVAEKKVIQKKEKKVKKEARKEKGYPTVVHRRKRKIITGKKAGHGTPKKTEITTPKAIKRKLKIYEIITVGELSKRMGVKASEVIKKLWELGFMATINQSIDVDTAQLISEEFGYEVEKVSLDTEEIFVRQKDKEAKLVPRPPIITVMGHVDHGKTKLLDAIRETDVIGGEAGGITQHIGAYHVKLKQGEIVFIDTPGHKAFTAMRARGSQVTDIVILVVAATEGVKEQTIEAINHAKDAKVPIIVAINKIDLPEAVPEKVTRELAERGLAPEAWGGDTIFVEISAKQKTNIDKLLEMILLQAEILELKANPDKLARGIIIESRLDKGQGPVATVLIQEGTLKAGDPFASGRIFGKVRAMLNDRGKKIKRAGPSIPVEVLGFSRTPKAGDSFIVVSEERKARTAVEHQREKERQEELGQSNKVTLDNLFDKIKEEEFKELKLIIKADVHGSIEALGKAINDINTNEEKIKLNLVHGSVGAISESDVMLASVSNAIIIGFSVAVDHKAQGLAAIEGVDIRIYNIIYEVIDDVRKAMEGLLSPIQKEKLLGRAEVVEVFQVSKIGIIAGSKIVDGKMIRGAHARLFRNDAIVHEGTISTLRRFKEDVKEVLTGYECGIKLEDFNDVHLNDIIEAYVYEEVAPKLE